MVSQRFLVHAFDRVLTQGKALSTRSIAMISTSDEPAMSSLPKIFDIFDVPVRLGESSKRLRGHKAAGVPASTSKIAQLGGSRVLHSYSVDMGLPATLSPPVIFDGPARPTLPKTKLPNTRHRLGQGNLSSSPPKTSTLTFTPKSEILYEIFDGPSRITRYQCHSILKKVRQFPCPFSYKSQLPDSEIGAV